MIRLPNLLIVSLIVLAGCGDKSPATMPKVTDVPNVRVVHPEIRDLSRPVGQPSFVDAYEQTAIYAKLPAYVLEWDVDIGDRLKKDELMATLFIPELFQEWNLKKADVTMNRALLDQAHKLVEVAVGNLKAAKAKVTESKADVGKFEALVRRWDSEVARQVKMVSSNVIDRQILDESRRQFEASIASNEAAVAAVDTAKAIEIARTADLDKAKVDVEVAEARLQVAQADEQRLAALYGYTRLTSPFPGIVVLRNANTGDFVLPATGDPSASNRSPDQGADKATPIYVVARTDIVRVYVDVPENEANYIVSRVDKNAGDPRPISKASVLVRAFQNDAIPAEVTRSSWALNMRSRTLRVEIDLDNPDARLLPGMYAYGTVMIERPQVMALPADTLVELGNQTVCFICGEKGALKVPVQTGLRADGWVEVVKKKEGDAWVDFTGEENVISGDLSELSEGCPIHVVGGDKPHKPDAAKESLNEKMDLDLLDVDHLDAGKKDANR